MLNNTKVLLQKATAAAWAVHLEKEAKVVHLEKAAKEVHLRVAKVAADKDHQDNCFDFCKVS